MASARGSGPRESIRARARRGLEERVAEPYSLRVSGMVSTTAGVRRVTKAGWLGFDTRAAGVLRDAIEFPDSRVPPWS